MGCIYYMIFVDGLECICKIFKKLDFNLRYFISNLVNVYYYILLLVGVVFSIFIILIFCKIYCINI